MPTHPHETLACLIIDDPLLKPTYGCLNYEALLAQMQKHRFFTQIAFIPYNWRRGDARTVQLFSENKEYLGLCVHGCNHTKNEFGAGTYETLSELASTALWRMEKHKELTGLDYDPVMVFPQGRFSSLALRVLKEQGYIAAFNSTLQPTDGQQPPACEFEMPASTALNDFPVFLRRYPNDRDGFLRDINFGRPILIVEHHKAFLHGYQTITELVDWINSFGNVRWTSLGEIAGRFAQSFVADHHCSRDLSAPPSLSRFQARVGFRRLLSEFRDNVVETHPVLSTAYEQVRKLTG